MARHFVVETDNDDDDDRLIKHPIDPLAQKLELLDRYRRAQQQAHLRPGDLCREKPGLSMFTHGPVMIFWRWLDIKKLHDRMMIEGHIRHQMSSYVDCLVGFLSDDSHAVRLSPCESWRLEHLE